MKLLIDTNIVLNDMEGLITRKSKDYQGADINIWSPEQALKEYAAKGEVK